MGLFSKKSNELKDVNFYFYFNKNNKVAAKNAEKYLISRGFKTDFHWLEHGSGQQSLTLNKKVSDLDETGTLEKTIFVDITKKYNGEYDGHKIAL